MIGESVESAERNSVDNRYITLADAHPEKVKSSHCHRCISWIRIIHSKQDAQPILRRSGVSWGCVGIELARLISPFGPYPLFSILRKFFSADHNLHITDIHRTLVITLGQARVFAYTVTNPPINPTPFPTRARQFFQHPRQDLLLAF